MIKFKTIYNQSGKIVCPVCGHTIMCAESKDGFASPCKHVLAWYCHSFSDFCDGTKKVWQKRLETMESKAGDIDLAFKHVFKYEDACIRRYNGRYLGGCTSDSNIVAYKLEG